jgi:molybdate transport system permease protein
MTSRLGDRLGVGLFTTLAAVTLVFLVLPIVAIFVHTTPGRLIGELSNPVVRDAFVVTLKTSVAAQALILFFGTPTAYLLATRRFQGHSLAVTLVELPLVMPPAVAGLGLLFALGRVGLLGSSLSLFGISIPFTQTAVTIAVAYVASPLYIRQAIAAFEAVDPRLPAASRTLGAGTTRTFFRVMLPLARGGLLAGLALSFARGLGEFGATIMFAGNLQGVTQTLSLAIYTQFEGGSFDTALAMGGVLVLVSAVLLLTLRIALSWQRSPSNTSPSLFGLSSST